MEMAAIGLGTFQVKKEACYSAVQEALEVRKVQLCDNPSEDTKIASLMLTSFYIYRKAIVILIQQQSIVTKQR